MIDSPRLHSFNVIASAALKYFWYEELHKINTNNLSH